MALWSESLEKFLKCRNCSRRFEEPKELDCRHTFCKNCLERLVSPPRLGKQYKIKCPECGKKKKVPNGNVANLPSNHLINHLLDIRSNANSKPFCRNHGGKILSLFCLTCHHLICRDCTLIDHREHEYKFVKDVFPAEREKILNAVRKLKEKIPALEASMNDFGEQKKSLDQNAQAIKKKIDDFFDKKIKFLKEEKQRKNDELQKSLLTQKEKLNSDMKGFSASLDFAKCRLEVTEHILAKIGDEDALLAKDEILRQLNGILPHSVPTPQMNYDFGPDDMSDVIKKITASSLY